MNKLFGTAKKKEEPKPNINAPTLSETSAKVCSDKILRYCSNENWFVDGPKRQGNQWKGRGMQPRACKDQERNGYSQRNKTEDSQIKSSSSA